MFIVAAEKAQKPANGVKIQASSSLSCRRRVEIFELAAKRSFALSSHQPGGPESSRRGESTGPLGRDTGVGRNGMYSRHRNNMLRTMLDFKR
jgi:hypothetical protein